MLVPGSLTLLFLYMYCFLHLKLLHPTCELLCILYKTQLEGTTTSERPFPLFVYPSHTPVVRGALCSFSTCSHF